MVPWSSRRVARRTFLGVSALLACSIGAAPTRAAIALGRRWEKLDGGDRQLANLARASVRLNPAHAARVFREVEAEVERTPEGASHPGRPTPRNRARKARRTLLEPSRIAAELEAGEVETLDGWVLARSEARLAVYLAHLTGLGAD